MQVQSNTQPIQVQNGLVTDMIEFPYIKNSVVLALSSGQISYLLIDSLVHLNSVKVFKQYATSLCPFNGGICVGSKNGNLAILDSSNQITNFIKLHKDCISSIIETQQYLVTSSYDGNLHFLDKKSLEISKTVSLHQPIFKAVLFNNCIYTTGNPSFQITCYSFQTRQLKRFDFFASCGRRLYACSDERGLTCVTSNSNSYIPCNFILPMKDKMIIVSDECIGELYHSDHMEWRCYKKKEIKVGTYLVGGCVVKDNVILGDQNGKIYKIVFDEPSEVKSSRDTEKSLKK